MQVLNSRVTSARPYGSAVGLLHALGEVRTAAVQPGEAFSHAPLGPSGAPGCRAHVRASFGLRTLLECFSALSRSALALTLTVSVSRCRKHVSFGC